MQKRFLLVATKFLAQHFTRKETFLIFLISYFPPKSTSLDKKFVDKNVFVRGFLSFGSCDHICVTTVIWSVFVFSDQIIYWFLYFCVSMKIHVDNSTRVSGIFQRWNVELNNGIQKLMILWFLW